MKAKAKIRTRVKPKAKPKDPKIIAAEKRAKAFVDVGLQAGAGFLDANADIEAESQTRDNAARARRMDAFEALFGRPTKSPETMAEQTHRKGCYIAARRLERELITAQGLHDRGRAMERVDGGESTSGRLDAMIAAMGDVQCVLGWLGNRDQWLLIELVSPSAAARVVGTSWRSIVAYVTGEENPHAQAARVRQACENLVGAYEKADRIAATQRKTQRLAMTG